MATIRFSGSFDDLDRFLEMMDRHDGEELTVTFSKVNGIEARSAGDRAFDSDRDDDESVKAGDEDDEWDAEDEGWDDEDGDWDDSDYEENDVYVIPSKSPPKSRFDDSEGYGDDQYREDQKRAREKEAERRRNESRNRYEDEE